MHIQIRNGIQHIQLFAVNVHELVPDKFARHRRYKPGELQLTVCCAYGVSLGEDITPHDNDYYSDIWKKQRFQ